MANLVSPLVLAQDLTAEFFNGSIDNMRSVAYQTADVKVNNTSTVYTTSPDLTLPLLQGASYIFESCLFFDTSAAADIVLVLNATLLDQSMIATWSSGTAITTATNNINQSATSATFFIPLPTCGGVSSGTVMSARPVGWFRSAVAGAITVSHTQGTATAVDTILRQGSWISLARVA